MKGKSDEALATLLADTRKSLREQRYEAAAARPKDSNQPRKMRKIIARVLTEQGARARLTAQAGAK